eukprot:COSAG01_NODE_62828_length_282_cov_2.245902_1_plen_25_part_10
MMAGAELSSVILITAPREAKPAARR